MKQYFLRPIGFFALLLCLSSTSFAQDEKSSDKIEEDEVIIIRKKGDKNTKVSVEINDGEVKVNGKPLSEFNHDNISVRIQSERKLFNNENFGRVAPVPPRSPFRRGGDVMYNSNSNKAFLGVMTDEDENGAKITEVTEGSAAEKAGLKKGDVITKVDGREIKNPTDLTTVITNMKPEATATIVYKRNEKEQKATAKLGKRSPANVVIAPDNVVINDFNMNYELANNDFAMWSGKGRLGIKAQDTEDGKGVKVLGVDEASHASKAGIKEGDIITEFDGEDVNSATELATAAREAREKNNIRIKLSRDGKPQEFEIKIPKKLKTANL